jgi:biopolymer transport protein ExbD
MEFRRKKRAPVEIGLIPMIDVLLVLLFFFMLATTFRHHTDLKINLPEANGEDVEQPSKAINLFIDAEGKYAIAGEDGKPKPLVEQNLTSLKMALSELSIDAKQLPFIINADGKTPHQAVVSALDVANQLGFHHVTFAINPPEK